MTHISGDKISGSHTTVIDAAVPVVTFLVNQASVKKVILGFIDNNAATGSATRVKVIDEQTSIEVSVSGGGANQKLRVYLDNAAHLPRKHLHQALEAFATDEECKLSFLDRR